MVNVAVLLSAYNGDKFIKEQIESILNQNGVNVKLTIRNDGGDPEEKTRRIIREYVAKDERVSLLEGENLGCAKSFWQLLREAPEADYYAFADQDDVWLPDKLKAATDSPYGRAGIDLEFKVSKAVSIMQMSNATVVTRSHCLRKSLLGILSHYFPILCSSP